MENVQKWDGWMERILTAELKDELELLTVVTVYGPNKDAKKGRKNTFWGNLNVAFESSKENWRF